MNYENLEMLLQDWFEKKNLYDLLGKDKSKLNYFDIRELEQKILSHLFSIDYGRFENENDLRSYIQDLKDIISELEYEIEVSNEDS